MAAAVAEMFHRLSRSFWTMNARSALALKSCSEPGTSGAMSIEGTLAGVGSAAVLGFAAWALGLVNRQEVGVVVAAATAGSLVESALGATLEHRGVVNNDVLNFVNTGVAAFVAVKLAQSL